MTYLWTSEAVSSGHPDKLADQVADAILDAYLTLDPNSTVACEVTLTKGIAFITGEITSKAEVDVKEIFKNVLEKVGYAYPEHYNWQNVEVIDKINSQSPEIRNAVLKENGVIGAGDQGMMFGYATNESEGFVKSRELMPLASSLAFEVLDLIRQDIDSKRTEKEWGSIFLPDAKSQITIFYDDKDNPVYVDTVVISTQHKYGTTLEDVKSAVADVVISNYKDHALFNDKTKWLINPAGEWHSGGPDADTGLSGRKIVVDNYGSDCPVGGGSFSGKDPTKVDRSGAYIARYLAKNIVKSGLADKCQVQLSYAIGVADPVSVRVNTFGTFNKYKLDCDESLSEMISGLTFLTPSGIIEKLQLRNPIYQATASGGHFGRSAQEDGKFSWESTDDYDWNKFLVCHDN